jgi:hypothetical protein
MPVVMTLRRFGLVVGCAVLAILLTSLPVAGARFTGVTANPASGWGADSLDPTGSFDATRPCSSGAAVSPAYRDAANAATVGSTTSLTVSTPTSAAGDYFIAGIALASSATINTPAGWTLVRSTANGPMRLSVFAIARPASPPANYAFTWTGAAVAAGFIASYSGVASVGPSAATPYASPTDPISAPTLTPPSAPTTLLAIADIDLSSTTTASTPAGMASRSLATAHGSGGNHGTRLFDQAISTTSATGARTIDLSGARYSITTSVLLVPSASVDPTIDLTWTVTPDTWATGYEIIRSGGPTTPISGRNTLAWSDTTTTSTTAYTYTISATYLSWHSTTRTVNVAAC